MHGHGKSDGCIVPAKPSNNAASAAAEVVEGRRPAEGNTDRPTRTGRSAGQRVPSGLDRVREVARTDKAARFTALLLAGLTEFAVVHSYLATAHKWGIDKYQALTELFTTGP